MCFKQNKLLSKSKEIICLFVMAMFMLVFILFQYSTISNRNFENLDAVALANKFLIIAIIATVVVISSYFLLIKKEIAIHNIYFCAVTIMALSYMTIFLPYTVPDEILHYFSAYRVSNYFLFNFKQSATDVLLIRQSDIDFFNTTTHLQSVDYYYTIKNSIGLFSKDNNIIEFGVGYVKNVPFGYIISGLGIAVARLLRLSPLITFYFGRMFNIVAYSLMTRYAMKKIPYGKIAIFAISALPMLLHLIASYSYDSIIVSFAILFISQVLYMREKEGVITVKDIVLCAIFGVLLAPSKMVYIPILLIIYIIPNEKFGLSYKKAYIIKTTIFLVAIAIMLLIQSRTIANSVGDPELSWSEEEARSVSWVIKHPIQTLKVYINTLFSKGEYYVEGMAGASLGWLQINVPGYVYEPFYLFLVYSFMMRKDEEKDLCFYNKLWIFLIIIAGVFLVLTSMLLAWTPMSSMVIEGVQGRYFIPFLLLLMLVLRNKHIIVSKRIDKYFIFLLIYSNLFAGIEYFVTSFK